MQALTGEKLARMIAASRAKVAALDPAAAAEIDATLAIDFEEHYTFQNQQAAAHAGGILTPEAAQIVYNALGPVHGASNGGWSSGADTATKYLVTQLIGELLAAKIGRAA